MRLYLSSYRLGACTDRLLALLEGGRRAAVISNALDHLPAQARETYRQTQYDPIAEFAGLGIDATDLDLRDFFHDPDRLKAHLAGFDLVWAMGGNAFLLLRAMTASGFGDAIRSMLDADAIVYGGFSAGAIVAAPSLRGIDCMDPPTQIAEGYQPDIVWDALGLVDFSIVPHYRSNHPETALADRAVARLQAMGARFVALADGEAVVQDGTTLQICGEGSDRPIGDS